MLPKMWGLAEGSFSRLSCLRGLFHRVVGNTGLRGALTCKSASNKPFQRPADLRKQQQKTSLKAPNFLTYTSLLRQQWLQEGFHGDKTQQWGAGWRWSRQAPSSWTVWIPFILEYQTKLSCVVLYWAELIPESVPHSKKIHSVTWETLTCTSHVA